MKKPTFRRSSLSILAIFFAIAALFASGWAENASSLANAKLFGRAVTAIEENYVDPERIDPKKMLDGSLLQMQRAIPEILVKDKSDAALTLVVGLAQKQIGTGPVGSLSDLNRVMGEILSFIAANYHGDTPPEEIEYAAIDGMLEVLDPHSNFMPPKVYNEFRVGTRGKFGGLGIVISIKDGQLTVIAPIEGTPASRAGIKTGDRILQIGDESTINMSLTDAVNKLRGDVGSKVAIIVERSGLAPRKIALTRALINIESVKHQTFADAGKKIGYLKIKSFQSNTDEDVKIALDDFRRKGAPLDGLILDLRNNPGGLLNIAVEVTDHFLSDGVIVTTVGPHDSVIEKENAHSSAMEEKYPIIVLINEGSASASEIVAGALKENDRAVVMGMRSFGKGSVQTLFELGGGSALKLTIAKYKPAGVQDIQLVGLTPDVFLQPVTVDAKNMNLIEDILPSEFDLEQHLGGAVKTYADQEFKSQYHVRYLKPAADEKSLENESIREYAKEPDVEKDFAVNLARRMLTSAGRDSRKAMLSGVGESIAAAEKDSQSSIDAALKPLSINWEDVKAAGEPKLTLSYNLISGKSRVPRAKAGDKIELQLSATNNGTGSYSRLIAVGQSDMPFLSNREFVFGRLDPGVTRAWTVPIELPEGMPSQDLVMDVTFEEGNRRAIQPLNIIIPADELPEPAFAFSFKTLNLAKGKPWPAGVAIPIDFEITNTGKGSTSKDTVATLSNECGEGMFIEKGRVNLGAMPPNTTRRAPFKFHLSSAGKPEGKCEIKLTVADLKRYAVLTKKLDLSLQTGGISPAAGVKYAPPVIELAKFPSSTADTSVKISGTINNIGKVRDYFIFAGEKKIAYVPNAAPDSTMKFETFVPLEPGSNIIVIGARDQEDLMGRKVIVIDRTSGEKKKKDRRASAFDAMPGVSQ